MKLLLAATLALMVISTTNAQEANTKIRLKTDQTLEGKLIKTDEDGLTLDISGTKLFIKWAYTRGDKHFDLRKKITDYKSVESLFRLADFCHEFAMDEQESRTLVAILELEQDNAKALARLAGLPKVEGLEIPGQEPPKPPPVEPDPDPAPAKPEPGDPAPSGKIPPYGVYLTCDDAVAKEWLEEHVTEDDYKLGNKKIYFVRVEVDIDYTLVRNPKFFGAELFAVYKAKLTYKMFKKGAKKAFVKKSFETKNVRGNSKAEALRDVRTEVLDASYPEIYDSLESQRTKK